MARKLYTVTAPDGTTLTHTTSDHCSHTVAVIGLMRLRKRLPKSNPDDPNEEPQFERFKAWVMIGTSDNQRSAERLATSQGYRNVTEEVRYYPVQGVLLKKNAGTTLDGDDDEPTQVPVAVNLDDI